MSPQRSGTAAIGMVLVLVLVTLMVMSLVHGTARDHDLTARRVESVAAFYVSEAGANMSVRELIDGVDDDGDGTVGTISDDADNTNDPAFGSAQVVVTTSTTGGVTTLTSQGRSGKARREIESVVEE